MDIISNEARALMRAVEVAGVELPDHIAEAVARLEHTEAQMATLGPATVPSAAELVAGGMDLDKATKEVARLQKKADDEAEGRRVVATARGLARRDLSRLVGLGRDDVIVAMRPTVDAIIAEARPLAQVLERFAPKYAAGDVAYQATPDELVAWQAAVELERRFGACIAYWRAAWKSATTRGGYNGLDGEAAQVPYVLRYWRHPELVTDPALDGSRRKRYGAPADLKPTVLGPASGSAWRPCSRPWGSRDVRDKGGGHGSHPSGPPALHGMRRPAGSSRSRLPNRRRPRGGAWRLSSRAPHAPAEARAEEAPLARRLGLMDRETRRELRDMGLLPPSRRGDPRNRVAWRRARAALRRDFPTGPCAWCGRAIDPSLPFNHRHAWTADHVVPLARGGDPFAPENLRPMHRACNSQRQAGGRRVNTMDDRSASW